MWRLLHLQVFNLQWGRKKKPHRRRATAAARCSKMIRRCEPLQILPALHLNCGLICIWFGVFWRGLCVHIRQRRPWNFLRLGWRQKKKAKKKAEMQFHAKRRTVSCVWVLLTKKLSQNVTLCAATCVIVPRNKINISLYFIKVNSTQCLICFFNFFFFPESGPFKESKELAVA